MKIIAGLGNPGREYANTRHNLGFMVVDEIARRLPPVERRNRFRAEVLEIFASGEKIILVKPQTYMNLSGASVREAMRWYRVPLEETLVIADDIDLPFGAIRMRASGGSGGHNGLKSIIAEASGPFTPIAAASSRHVGPSPVSAHTRATCSRAATACSSASSPACFRIRAARARRTSRRRFSSA